MYIFQYNILHFINSVVIIKILLITACSKEQKPNPPIPEVSPPQEIPIPKNPTFTNPVQNIFANKCFICHNKRSMPGKDWTKYEQAYKYRKRIYDRVIIRKDMPKGLTMTNEEREIIKKWIDQGAKE